MIMFGLQLFAAEILHKQNEVFIRNDDKFDTLPITWLYYFNKLEIIARCR